MMLARRPSSRNSSLWRRRCTDYLERRRSRWYSWSTIIVSVIIGEMLWDPKDVEGQTHSNIVVCFTDVWGNLEALQGGQGQDWYRIFIKNQLHWYMVIDFLSMGLSLCQAYFVLQHTKKRGGLAESARAATRQSKIKRGFPAQSTYRSCRICLRKRGFFWWPWTCPHTWARCTST